MISTFDIDETHKRISAYIHRTPILTNSTINDLVGANVYFKCENFQKTGSFKARGALNAVLKIAENQKPQSFATHSSGNHAQAIAYASKEMQIPCYVVMPKTASQVKKAAVRSYGAEIIECEPTTESREEEVKKFMKSKGSAFIHPFDNDMVICGQATAGKELLENVSQPLDCIIAPVGGGGLLSGTSLTAHHFSASTLVYGAEPEGAADAIYSFKTGNVERSSFIDTIADGLLTSLSERTLSIIRTHVKDIFLVSEDEIKGAMRLIWERMKIIVEPSSAVALAAVIKNKSYFSGQNIGIIISGGNVDFSNLPF